MTSALWRPSAGGTIHDERKLERWPEMFDEHQKLNREEIIEAGDDPIAGSTCGPSRWMMGWWEIRSGTISECVVMGWDFGSMSVSRSGASWFTLGGFARWMDGTWRLVFQQVG